MKTLPFIVILASAFQHSLKWMRECLLFRKLKYVGENSPSSIRSQKRLGSSLTKRITLNIMSVTWERKHTLSKCDLLKECFV